MKLAILILKEEELLDAFIKKCASNEIKNITVMESNSYESEKVGKRVKNDTHILNSIRYMLDYYNDESRVLLIPISSDKFEKLKEITNSLVSLDQYTLMSINIEEIIGLEK